MVTRTLHNMNVAPYNRALKISCNKYSKSVFLNTRRYRDLDTFLPGLRSLEKLKIDEKLQWNHLFCGKRTKNQVFLSKRHLKNHLPGQLATKQLVTGTEYKKIILPGPWLENHCSNSHIPIYLWRIRMDKDICHFTIYFWCNLYRLT
jgi:hypothetical protein